MARILDRKIATSGLKNRSKSAKNHHELVPVLGFGWKLSERAKNVSKKIKKGFRCISEAKFLVSDDISWSRD